MMKPPGTSQAKRAQSRRHTLLEIKRRLKPDPQIHYIDHPFTVPESASKIGLTLSFRTERRAHVYVSLQDRAGLRGHRMRPGTKGQVELDLWLSPNDASEGSLPGPIPGGEWLARVDLVLLTEEIAYRLLVYAELEPIRLADQTPYPVGHTVNPEPGWYKGELHCHSSESDGRYTVDRVVQAAVDAGLDFLSITDHFTVSQWRKQGPLQDDRLALLRSCELTSHRGHANLHGINSWIDVYVDRPGWSMNQVAESVHEQHGLFCVNHAFAGILGWRSYDFDWSLADLLEIYHGLEGPNNNLQLALWDHHLRVGRHIVGVGGTDSHDPSTGLHELGQLVTWVHAEELSESGIVGGLRNGQVYVSRGSELRFSARDHAGHSAEMGATLPLGHGPVVFDVQTNNREPLRLFMLKNGYPFEELRLSSGDGTWRSVRFSDDPRQPAYYRLELHSIFPDEPHEDAGWRDYSTVQALSNPIWVGRIRNDPPVG